MAETDMIRVVAVAVARVWSLQAPCPLFLAHIILLQWERVVLEVPLYEKIYLDLLAVPLYLVLLQLLEGALVMGVGRRQGGLVWEALRK